MKIDKLIQIVTLAIVIFVPLALPCVAEVVQVSHGEVFTSQDGTITATSTFVEPEVEFTMLEGIVFGLAFLFFLIIILFLCNWLWTICYDDGRTPEFSLFFFWIP